MSHARPLGQAAAQLVCRRRSRQQLGACADERAHQSKDLEEAVLQMNVQHVGQLQGPSTPYVLVQQVLVGLHARPHS